MKVVLFAYRDCGYECLNYLLKIGQKPLLVVVPKKEDQNEKVFKSVIKLASSAKINLIEYSNNQNVLEREILALNPDYGFSCYFPYIISDSVIKLFSKCCFNIHGGILPEYKGALSSVWSIINNEKFSGATIHLMSKEIDCGNIVEVKKCKINDLDTGFSLYKKVEKISILLFKKYFQILKNQKEIISTPQIIDSGSYYNRNLPFNGTINWSWKSRDIYNFCRAMYFPPFEPAVSIFNKRKFQIKFVTLTKIPSTEPPGQVIDIAEDNITVSTADFNIIINSDNFNLEQFNNQLKLSEPKFFFK